jgi:hypothetical protein
VEFALPAAGAMTEFLNALPAGVEASPFAGLADDDLAEARCDAESPAGPTRSAARTATAGLIALAAAIIAVTGMAVVIVLRSVAK